MRVVTTFDERLYQETGRHLVESLRSHLTSEQILVYGENMTSPLYGVQMLDVASLPELDQILVACRDIIPRESGGDADTLKGYNQRWYNWFRKVIVQYDAIVRRPNSGYTIFLDSDVRMVKSPDEAVMASVLVSAVGVLLGDRESIESGGHRLLRQQSRCVPICDRVSGVVSERGVPQLTALG